MSWDKPLEPGVSVGQVFALEQAGFISRRTEWREETLRPRCCAASMGHDSYAFVWWLKSLVRVIGQVYDRS